MRRFMPVLLILVFGILPFELAGGATKPLPIYVTMVMHNEDPPTNPDFTEDKETYLRWRNVLVEFAKLLPGICIPAEQRSESPKGGIQEIRDVVYRTVDGVSLALDIYLPRTSGPHPAVLLVHGGGWHGGDKRSFAAYGRILAREGFAAFSVNYRLAPQFHYPAALEDLRCAVKWVREHAGDWGVDPGRIAAVGSSAGGHLVALLGTAPEGVGD